MSAPQISEGLSKLVQDQGLLKNTAFIGGKWLDAQELGEPYEVLDPSTNQVIASVSKADGATTNIAINRAQEAQISWRNLTGKERSVYLRRWFEEIQRNLSDLATIATAENGKPLNEAKVEIEAGWNSVEWFAEEAKRVCGDVLETVNKDRRMLVIKQPIGVVGAITPWNFPSAMITRKIAPAIACGCTVVLKPSELTPLSAFALAELADRAGMPPGVINIVSGEYKSIGQALLKSPIIRKIDFTGSTAVGKYLMEQSAETVKKVSMELGGNAPFIVFEDADLEQAAKAAVLCGFRNAGQACSRANRIFVQDAIYDEFEKLVTQIVSKFQVGSGLDSSTVIGPVINAQALAKVSQYVADAVEQGAQVTTGGSDQPHLLEEKLKNGNFYAPTVIREVNPQMRCFREETFGPLLPLIRFKTTKEVIQMANDTEYGLAAYFYAKDLRRVWEVAEQLEFGMVGVNEYRLPSEVAPFGGLKQSGIGKENSKYGIEEFLEMKYICMGINY
eukprot:TRINITY_DN2069_c0_g2_i8.p1 TRINITY_DN2069_c0_g2~~TRINITY_DN2069_c0_g2_i8.p1  ORF type:complete len:533 (-),score=85.67 TRINITY_DN2069_c0_g2_i8:169-1680(-)